MLFFGHLYFSFVHFNHTMKNRSRLEIKAQIIKTIGNKGAIQSKIMYEVYLSFVQMKRTWIPFNKRSL
ncbi:winged helix-turn-helix domain-containing protein [Candidatus Nitrosocosmicus sp. T]